MQTVLYDGTFEGFLCAVFDVYEYRFTEASICTEKNFNGNIFEKIHRVHNDLSHSERVWKGLQKKLMQETLDKLYRTFLSEEKGIENILLEYIRYAFRSKTPMEGDFSHPAVVAVSNKAKSVYREKHRMEAFVRFQKTADGLFYSLIEPDYNVLPLIASHFEKRYADQPWLIYDGRRKYGIHYDLELVREVKISFSAETSAGKQTETVQDESEQLYQDLWAAYFNSVNIAARKNTRLHLQHMPLRYWKYLPEKQRNALRQHQQINRPADR